MTHNFIRRLTEIRLSTIRDETRLPRKLLLVLEKQICTLMSGAEEQSKQLPYVLLRPVWSRERLLLWQLGAGRAQRGPRTVPRHGFLQTDPGQSNSQWEGAVGGLEEAQGCALTLAGRGALPRSAPAAPAARPRTELWGAGQSSGPGPAVTALPAPWGQRGAPSRDRASPPPSAGSRAPFYITGGSAAVTQRTAELPRPGHGTGGREGRGPRLSPSEGLAPPPCRPLPGVTSATCAGSGIPGLQANSSPSLPFPPPSFPARAPSPPLTIAALGAAGERPASRSRHCAPSLCAFFSFPPSLPPCLPPRPGSEYCLSRPGTRLP